MKLIKRVLNKIYMTLISMLDDYWYSKLNFIKNHKYFPNLKQPRSLSEKINHIKLYKIDTLREKIVDRIWVREYVNDKAPSCQLINNLWVGENFTLDAWNDLPLEFVIKGNHGSGMVKVVNKDIDKFEDIEKLTKKWLVTDYSKLGREWFYNKVKPLIIVEEKLEFNSDIPPDFKFFCFNSKVNMVQVDSDRFTSHTRNLYDANFNDLDVVLHYKKGLGVEKPKLYESAVNIAESLSSDFDFIRVDLYILDDKIYFGELTNIPGNGCEKFYPKDFDFELGDRLKLHEK